MGELRGGTTVAGYIVWHGGNLQKSEFAPAVHQHVIDDVTGLQTALNKKSDSTHIHDNRYYLKTELDSTSATSGAAIIGTTAIAGLAGANVQTVLGSMKTLIDTHNHDGRYYTETELTNNTTGVTVHWGNLTNVPTAFTPVVHNHDDRYFTETEIGATTGAGLVGTAAITGLPGTNVQSVLVNLKAQLDGKLDSTGSGDLVISKSNAWATLKSLTSGSNGVEQAAGISIGEGGTKGSTAIHLAYVGDGYGYLGMGAVNATTGIPQYSVLKMHYTNNNAEFQGDVAVVANSAFKFATHGGTINMTEASWIRFNKGIYAGSNIIRGDGALQVGAEGATFLASPDNLAYKGKKILYEENPEVQVKTNTFGNDYDSGKKLNKVVEHKRTDGTLQIKSTLSNPDAAGNYLTLTIQYYAANGTTITSTQTWTLTYNIDGIITSKVLS